MNNPECYGNYGLPSIDGNCDCIFANSCIKKTEEKMYKTRERLSDIDVCRPFNGDHAKAMQGALGVQVGGSHYKDMALQPIEFIERNKLSFSAGNVIKYVCRADKKGGVEDLQKAKHYIELMIEMADK